MNSWTTYSISEVGRVVTGRTPPSSRPECFGGGYPFITPSDMDGRRTMSTTARTISEAGAQLLSRIEVPKGSVCVSCIGWQLGKVVLTDQLSFTNQQINSLTPSEEFDHLFIYYALKMKREEIRNLGAMGVRTPIVNKSTFSSIQIKVPPLPLQCRIASILSTYDDLIENNARRIAILEEMARRIYEEWFVHFRFPGYEDHGHSKKLPDGWELGKLAHVADLGGKSIAVQSNPNQFYLHYSFPAYDQNRQPENSAGDAIKSNKIAFPVPAVLVAKLNPRIPRIWSVRTSSEHPQICSTEFMPLVPRTGWSVALIEEVVKSPSFREHLAGLASGTSTSHQRVKPKDALAAPLTLPPRVVTDRANSVLEPMALERDVLHNQNANLRTQRDLLLPKLISGEIDVSQAQEALEEAAA